MNHENVLSIKSTGQNFCYEYERVNSLGRERVNEDAGPAEQVFTWYAGGWD